MIELQQNSEEWHLFRKNKIGASDAPIIMDVSPWKNIIQLWEEKLGIGETYQSDRMKRGHDLEDEARRHFETHVGFSVSPKVVVHPTHDWMMASLDGICAEGKTIVEIKCPGEADHETALKGSVPDKYYPQLQHQIEVAGVEKSYYYSFDGHKGVTLVVFRDDKYIKELIEKEKEFYECVKQLKMPDYVPRGFELRQCGTWMNVASEWKQVHEQIKELEKKEEFLRGCLIEFSYGKNSIGGGVRVSVSERPGTIDYKKIPELKGVDLEKYRKPSKPSWRIDTTKYCV
jgi:putative phage-type endonuclease